MSSDSAMTTPFQIAAVVTCVNAGRGPRSPVLPAEGVHLPRLRGPAGSAVTPRDDVQRGGRGAALGALDGLGALGPRFGDLAGPFLVDALVAAAGATQMGFGTSAVRRGDG